MYHTTAKNVHNFNYKKMKLSGNFLHTYFFLLVQYRWRFSYTVITIKVKYNGCELLIWGSASLYKQPRTFLNVHVLDPCNHSLLKLLID